MLCNAISGRSFYIHFYVPRSLLKPRFISLIFVNSYLFQYIHEVNYMGNKEQQEMMF